MILYFQKMDRFVSKLNVTRRTNEGLDGEQGHVGLYQSSEEDMFASPSQNYSSTTESVSSPSGLDVELNSSLVFTSIINRNIRSDVNNVNISPIESGSSRMRGMTPDQRGSPTLKNSSTSDSGISSPSITTDSGESNRSLVSTPFGNRDAHTDVYKTSSHNFVAPTSTLVANDSTPRSPNTRTCWTPFPLKVGSSYQMSIFCRNSNGRVGPFTSAKSAAKVRPCWAPLMKCELKLVMDSRSSATKEVFEITNTDLEKKDFRVDTLLPTMLKKFKAGEFSNSHLGGGSESFSNKLSHLIVKSPKLLGMYLSLASGSQGFCNHDPTVHLCNGLKAADNTEIDRIIELGGSMSDYDQFLQSVKDSALVIGEVKEQGYRIAPAVMNKKITDFFLNVNDNPKKMARGELAKFNYKQMVSKEGGLEKTVVNSYVDWCSIPLSKLKLSSENHILVVPSKVDEIVKSFLDRFDPAQIVFSVVPSNLEAFNKGDYEGDYHVIHGRHRLLALQKLVEHNRLGDLPNFPVNGKVQCYLMKISAASSSNYYTIRANDLSFNYQSCTTYEELFYVYRGLLQSMKEPEQCLKTIHNICYSRLMKPDVIAVYNKIAKWPISSLDNLIETLKKFQVYQTKDANEKGDQTKIKRRQAKALTKTLFIQLGNCCYPLFDQLFEKVLNNELSLKELLEKSETYNKKADVESKAVYCAGVPDFQTLKTAYPGKFSSEILEKFAGAEVIGRKRNAQGNRLENYVKSLKFGKAYEDVVKLESFAHWSDVTVQRIGDADVIVISVSSKNLEAVDYWICELSPKCRNKNHFSAILVIQDQKFLQHIYVSLANWKDIPDFSVRSCILKKNSAKADSNGFCDNSLFCVFFGKINVFKEEILSFYDNIDKGLATMVSALTPPSGKVVYISDGEFKVPRLHEISNTSLLTIYYVTERELVNVRDRFMIKAAFHRNQEKGNETRGDQVREECEKDSSGEIEDEATH